MYLISAYFDEATNKQLQGYIDRISQATGNDFMVAHNVPPHLTLSAIEARSVDVLVQQIFDSFASIPETTISKHREAGPGKGQSTQRYKNNNSLITEKGRYLE